MVRENERDSLRHMEVPLYSARKLEAALTAGKKSLAELAAAIVELKPQPELVAEPPGHQLRAERVGFEPVGQ